MLKKLGMYHSKPALTPMEVNVKLRPDVGEVLVADVNMYQKMVGMLLYATLTRLDLCYSVGVLSQFMQEPRNLILMPQSECFDTSKKP